VLQICVDHRCLLFQILHADYVPNALFRFLADHRFTFVGVGIGDDVAKLRAGYGLWVASAVDLRALAADTLGRPDLRRAGLPALVWLVMGVQMEKPHHVRVSAWDAPTLSDDQLKYACADAFASFEVGRRLYDGDY
jgi:ribonuclease D